jgi:hypothetical protein
LLNKALAEPPPGFEALYKWGSCREARGVEPLPSSIMLSLIHNIIIYSFRSNKENAKVQRFFF